MVSSLAISVIVLSAWLPVEVYDGGDCHWPSALDQNTHQWGANPAYWSDTQSEPAERVIGAEVDIDQDYGPSDYNTFWNTSNNTIGQGLKLVFKYQITQADLDYYDDIPTQPNNSIYVSASMWISQSKNDRSGLRYYPTGTNEGAYATTSGAAEEFSQVSRTNLTAGTVLVFSIPFQHNKYGTGFTPDVWQYFQAYLQIYYIAGGSQYNLPGNSVGSLSPSVAHIYGYGATVLNTPTPIPTDRKSVV